MCQYALFAKIFIPVMKYQVSTVAVGAKTIVTAYNAGKGMEMFEKTLSQLEERLMEISPDQIEKYYDENREELLRDSRGFFRYMNEILKNKELSKQDVLLYARDKRDALIMACFNKRPASIIEVNEYLLKNKMAPLRSSGVQD